LRQSNTIRRIFPADPTGDARKNSVYGRERNISIRLVISDQKIVPNYLAFPDRRCRQVIGPALPDGVKSMKFKRFYGAKFYVKSKIRMYNSPTSRMRL